MCLKLAQYDPRISTSLNDKVFLWLGNFSQNRRIFILRTIVGVVAYLVYFPVFNAQHFDFVQCNYLLFLWCTSETFESICSPLVCLRVWRNMFHGSRVGKIELSEKHKNVKASFRQEMSRNTGVNVFIRVIVGVVACLCLSRCVFGFIFCTILVPSLAIYILDFSIAHLSRSCFVSCLPRCRHRCLYMYTAQTLSHCCCIPYDATHTWAQQYEYEHDFGISLYLLLISYRAFSRYPEWFAYRLFVATMLLFLHRDLSCPTRGPLTVCRSASFCCCSCVRSTITLLLLYNNVIPCKMSWASVWMKNTIITLCCGVFLVFIVLLPQTTCFTVAPPPWGRRCRLFPNFTVWHYREQ